MGYQKNNLYQKITKVGTLVLTFKYLYGCLKRFMYALSQKIPNFSQKMRKSGKYISY